MAYCTYTNGECVVCGHASARAALRRECDGPVARQFRSLPQETARRHGVVAGGPGTELKKMLARIGIVATPDCSCNRVSAQMDAWGPGGCEQPERMEYILSALRENAVRLGLPFFDAAGKLLVRRAIAIARRKHEALHGQKTQDG